MKDDKILQQAMERFDRSETSESVLREQAREDLEFAGGKQWEDSERVGRLGRPTLTVNKISGSLKKVKGDQRKITPSIKVHPVDSGADPEVAKIYNGLIKNIETVSTASAIYNAAFDQAIESGFGYFRIDTDYCGDDTFDQEIKIVKIQNQFSVYIDPDCSSDTCDDADWCLIAENISKDEYDKLYPDVEAGSFPLGTQEYSDWENEDTVRVAEYYWKEPVEHTLYLLEDNTTITSKEITDKGYQLETTDGVTTLVKFSEVNEDLPELDSDDEVVPSEFLIVEDKRIVHTKKVMWAKITERAILEGPTEKAGKYIPVVLVPGEVSFVKGKKVLSSAHHQARDAQKVYNVMVSTAVEAVALAPKQPWIVTPEQIEGYEQLWNKAGSAPLPYLLYNNTAGSQPPTRQIGSVTDQGANQERILAAEDIKATTGVHDAALGAPGSEISGQAIQARAIQSSIATFLFTDNLALAIAHAGKIIVDLIPYIYDTNRVLRILGADGKEDFAEINKVLIDPGTGETEVQNDLSVGKYDVTVSVGAPFATQKLEAVEALMGFVKIAPQYAPQLMDLIVKNMDFPDSDVVYERLQKMNQPAPPPVDPMDELKIKEKQLDIAKTQQELELNQLDQVRLEEDHVLETHKSKQSLRTGSIENMNSMQDLMKRIDEMDYKNEQRIMQVAGNAAEQALSRFNLKDTPDHRPVMDNEIDPYTQPPVESSSNSFGSPMPEQVVDAGLEPPMIDPIQ